MTLMITDDHGEQFLPVCLAVGQGLSAEGAQQRLLVRSGHSWRRNGALPSSVAGSRSLS